MLCDKHFVEEPEGKLKVTSSTVYVRSHLRLASVG